MHPSLVLRNAAGTSALKQGAKRDPELYVRAPLAPFPWMTTANKRRLTPPARPPARPSQQ